MLGEVRLNYYNEHDDFAAAWLEELIKENLIPQGVVDRRSITDVTGTDLIGFNQCHFFAGIGGWSQALNLAGWPEDRPVWTGSPPCQPFSVAGKQKGTGDDRHLWPHFFDLIRECRPPTVFGEQVAAAIKHGWFDALQNDMEGEEYACGMVVLPACSVGAPHIRQRLWYVAERVGNCNHEGLEGRESIRQRTDECPPWERSMVDEVGDSNDQHKRPTGQYQKGSTDATGSGEIDGVGIPNSTGPQQGGESATATGHGDTPESSGSPARSTLPTDGFWDSVDWLFCRDGKWRSTQPSIQPLAHGIPNRVGSLRGAGNAIVPQVAAEVIQAYMGSR